MTSRKTLLQRIQQPSRQPRTFKPWAYYDRDGDFIQFLARQVSFRAHRVDDALTVLYNQENPKEVVGCLLNDISQLRRSVPEIDSVVRVSENGQLSIKHLLEVTLRQYADRCNKSINMIYDTLIDLAEETDIRATYACAEETRVANTPVAHTARAKNRPNN